VPEFSVCRPGSAGALLESDTQNLRRVFAGPDRAPMDEWKTRAQKAWKSACRKAEIEDFRWHDIRHTWASWHVQQGTPLYALKELAGWEALEIVKRYAHLAPEHLKQYADRVTLGAALMAQIRHADGSGEETGAAVSSREVAERESCSALAKIMTQKESF
jgi:hypothetical protein